MMTVLPITLSNQFLETTPVQYVERTVSWLCYSVRGHDADLFTRQPQFKGVEPSIRVLSTIPEDMPVNYTQDGDNLFPPLSVSRVIPLWKYLIYSFVLNS